MERGVATAAPLARLLMSRLARYVGWQTFAAIALVLLVLVAIDALAALVEGITDIRGRYQFGDVLYEGLLTLPSRIYRNIPFAALIGCLTGLGILATNSELIVMRSAGISLLRITGFIAQPVLLIILFGAVLGEYVVPYADQWAESRRVSLRGEHEIFSGGGGVWRRDGADFVHVNAINPDGVLVGVARYRFGPALVLEEASFAATARFHDGQWQEDNGVLTRFTDNGTATEKFATRTWPTAISPELLMLLSMPPETLSIRSLYQYGSYLDSQGQRAGEYWLAFWGKALQPAAVISLVMIAISFVFGPLRDATLGFRIFAGVVVAVGFQMSMKMLGPASLVFGFAPFWAVMAPILGCFGLGAVLLRRAA